MEGCVFPSACISAKRMDMEIIGTQSNLLGHFKQVNPVSMNENKTKANKSCNYLALLIQNSAYFVYWCGYGHGRQFWCSICNSHCKKLCIVILTTFKKQRSLKVRQCNCQLSSAIVHILKQIPLRLCV